MLATLERRKDSFEGGTKKLDYAVYGRQKLKMTSDLLHHGKDCHQWHLAVLVVDSIFLYISLEALSRFSYFSVTDSFYADYGDTLSCFRANSLHVPSL